jgi:hypothetical protein
MRLIILKNLYFVVMIVITDVNHLHIKKKSLVIFSYIVIEDALHGVSWLDVGSHATC